MEIILHSNFVKQCRKLTTSQRKKFKERRDLFIIDPHHPLLNNHPLSGKYEGYRSINITGDIRAIYKQINNNFILFVAIGTHSSLYK